MIALTNYQIANLKALFDFLRAAGIGDTGDWFGEVHQMLEGITSQPDFSSTPNIPADDQIERYRRTMLLVKFNQGILEDEIAKIRMEKNKEINHLLRAMVDKQKVVDRQKEERIAVYAAIAEGKSHVELREIIESFKNRSI